ncbi:unnamed protein product, partial [Musa hybrid cultivar]
MLRSETLLFIKLLSTRSLPFSNPSIHSFASSNLSNAAVSRSDSHAAFFVVDDSLISVPTVDDPFNAEAAAVSAAEDTAVTPANTAAEAVAVAATASLKMSAISASSAGSPGASGGCLAMSLAAEASRASAFSARRWARRADESRPGSWRRVAARASDRCCLSPRAAERKDPCASARRRNASRSRSAQGAGRSRSLARGRRSKSWRASWSRPMPVNPATIHSPAGGGEWRPSGCSGQDRRAQIWPCRCETAGWEREGRLVERAWRGLFSSLGFGLPGREMEPRNATTIARILTGT